MVRSGVVASTLAIVIVAAPAIVAAQSLSLPSQPASSSDFAGALKASFRFLMFEHLARMTFQSKTRAELGGSFWSDYARSVSMPRTWGDTDGWAINYLGHPIQGAATGRIWIDYSKDRNLPTAMNASYLRSRGKAAAYSAIYSVQFEVGPLSEASIGNVGMRPETTGWTDYFITPAGAFGYMVAEDLLDKYVAKWVEARTTNIMIRAAVRVLCGPAHALANMSELRNPWYRSGRPLRGR
jgi:hypothetical protein